MRAPAVGTDRPRNDIAHIGRIEMVAKATTLKPVRSIPILRLGFRQRAGGKRRLERSATGECAARYRNACRTGNEATARNLRRCRGRTWNFTFFAHCSL